ncbi:d-4,5 unsaturated-glucuronyl hydrolase-like protein [Fistulina hepatica ATCC 64428]|nr:d-4,5 unsaturated-glucuronyl hydrolase-like protein [Fistulina hepatica ATCC 64428]
MLIHRTLISAFALLGSSIVLGTGLPSDLFSSVIPSKILSTKSGGTYPDLTDTSGIWQYSVADYWTSAFFSATFYLLNTRASLCGATSGNGLNSADWRTLGQATSTGLIPLVSNNSVGHDVGFLSYPFFDELSLDFSNTTAQKVVEGFGADLAARFSSIVGCTRSWDNTTDPTDFIVIIDNMMNLDLFFWAANITGNETYIDMAKSHADTTMKNQIRSDGSTWHVVEYNSTTGAVIRKRTAQGYSNNSTWTRGQAWGTYGYANMYYRTGDAKYLETSRRLADLFLSRIPDDGIIPWDFDAPEGDRPADTSAATIFSTALLFLSQQETDATNATKWANAAIEILTNTTNFAWSADWESLIKNGTSDKPSDSWDTGIVYGDYYLVKATNELLSMNLTDCSGNEVSASSNTTASGTASSATAASSQVNGARRSAGIFW